MHERKMKVRYMCLLFDWKENEARSILKAAVCAASVSSTSKCRCWCVRHLHPPSFCTASLPTNGYLPALLCAWHTEHTKWKCEREKSFLSFHMFHIRMEWIKTKYDDSNSSSICEIMDARLTTSAFAGRNFTCCVPRHMFGGGEILIKSLH